jgi:hypothetical protein
MRLIDWLAARSHRAGEGLIVREVPAEGHVTGWCTSTSRWHASCRGRTYRNNLWTKPVWYTPHG